MKKKIKPRIHSEKTTKKAAWNRYQYPVGLIDTSSFQGRVAWWNYASLAKTRPKEPLGLDCVAQHVGWSDVVAVGMTQNWEIEKLRLASKSVLHVTMSPYLAWVMAENKGLWCETVYMPSGLACDFTFPEANWVLVKILEVSDNPWNWLEAAQQNATEWVYVLVDRALKRRLHDIHPRDVLDKFDPAEWDCELLLMEDNTWISPANKIFNVMMDRMIVPMLFRRKPTSAESSLLDNSCTAFALPQSSPPG
jgi:hypothetical protein